MSEHDVDPNFPEKSPFMVRDHMNVLCELETRNIVRRSVRRLVLLKKKLLLQCSPTIIIQQQRHFSFFKFTLKESPSFSSNFFVHTTLLPAGVNILNSWIVIHNDKFCMCLVELFHGRKYVTEKEIILFCSCCRATTICDCLEEGYFLHKEGNPTNVNILCFKHVNKYRVILHCIFPENLVLISTYVPFLFQRFLFAKKCTLERYILVGECGSVRFEIIISGYIACFLLT